MRLVLSRREPRVVQRVLLVESGSRQLINRVVPILRRQWAGAQIDLVTCFPGVPEELQGHESRIFRVADYQGREGRARLFAELGALRHDVAGIICSGEPIMTKWKWAVAWKLRAKFLAINENGDYFWFDVAHRATLRRFAFTRMGLAGAGAGSAAARLLAFPFTLTYLLIYAASVHLKRQARIAFGRTAL